jgi:hypothetical protein
MLTPLFSRFRVIIAALSIAIFLLVFNTANLCYHSTSAAWLIDISFWLLSIGSIVAGLLDLSLFWRKTPLLSTLLLTIAGTGIVLFARISSTIYSLIETSFYAQPIGGSIVDNTSYRLVSISIFGSFMVLASTAISTLYKGHDVFHRSPTLYSLVYGKSINLTLLSFFIGFVTRLYPELKYQNPIGWDTLEYISVARDFSYQPKVLTTYIWLGGWRNLPPLLTWISGLLALGGIDPWIFFKIYPPVAMGIMSMLTASIAYKLSNSRWVGLASSLLTAFNPYILGQSQQWHRHVLGIIVLLAYLCEAKPLCRAITLAIASLSYELSAVIALFLSIAEMLNERKGILRKFMFLLSAALSLLALLWYVGFPHMPVMAVTQSGIYVAGTVEYHPESTLRYTITCVLLLSPALAVIPIWKCMDWRPKLSIAVLLTAFLLPALSVIAPVEQHRWFTMLLTLITPYTVVGLARLSGRFLALAILVVVVLGSAYPFTEYGFSHFEWPAASIAPAEGYPWKMEPMITNITDIKNAAEIINKDVVLVGLYLYPQLHLYIRNPVNITVVDQNPTLITAVNYAISKNLSRVLVVTTMNLSEQLEEFNNTIRCEALYRGRTLSVYAVEMRRQ